MLLEQEKISAKGILLTKEFFNRPTLRVAKDLLGKYLVRMSGNERIALPITEVEAYVGTRDLASHASHGKTSRNAVMFGPPGMWYVYFTYGMHWMLNIVTEREGFPAAVLIRGIRDITGPARLTKALAIDRRFNGLPAHPKTGLWIEDWGGEKARNIGRAPRIGIGHAGEWENKLWRFYSR